jgi:ferredoxin
MPNQAQSARFTVRITPSQRVFDAAPHDSLLEAAELSGISLPSSCRNGTCRTCICKLVSGTVTYRVEWPGLSAEEKMEGYTLPCVAQATSDLVIHQADATELWQA